MTIAAKGRYMCYSCMLEHVPKQEDTSAILESVDLLGRGVYAKTGLSESRLLPAKQSMEFASVDVLWSMVGIQRAVAGMQSSRMGMRYSMGMMQMSGRGGRVVSCLQE